VPHRRLTTLAIGAFVLVATIGASAQALPSVIEVENLRLEADGGFRPRTLSKRQFSPIDFQGRVEIASRSGGAPEPVRQIVVDFDRDGRLTAGGLPICMPEEIANATPAEARRTCGNAEVGSGHVEAIVSLASGPIPASSPLTLFNGPRLNGNPTVIVHAQTTVPGTQTYAIVVPIERRRGEFRYRATLNVPLIAAGFGAITHVDVKVGRRFSAGGKRRSYTAARCSDGILRTHGRFTFEDGNVIDGSVEKACNAK
jgi:hypothetical protein